MRSNEIFAAFLKQIGIPVKFKKDGSLYRTYSGPSYIFNPSKNIIAHTAFQTVFNGYEYTKEAVNVFFKVEDMGSSFRISRI